MPARPGTRTIAGSSHESTVGSRAPMRTSKLATMATKRAKSPSAAMPGAMIRVHVEYSSLRVRRKPMTASAVSPMRRTSPNAPMFVSHVKSVTTGKSGSVLPIPAIAKTRRTTRASPDCVSEPATGAPERREVRARKVGSTRSRPSAKKYRATMLWKATRAASSEVRKRRFARSTNQTGAWSARKANMRSGPSSCDCPMT
ncbi:Uncharacterised protein [Mycobacteroides abscessus subsp. abscessus]|nr:Uncharacterised protein [Mycobacteroides abscessus subsp. abscessus]